ncbi:MAG: ribonuclease R [Alistipes sp.]|jgi:ribonuclease R|nr:ribonuclease R [Alistipes sp.]
MAKQEKTKISTTGKGDETVAKAAGKSSRGGGGKRTNTSAKRGKETDPQLDMQADNAPQKGSSPNKNSFPGPKTAATGKRAKSKAGGEGSDGKKPNSGARTFTGVVDTIASGSMFIRVDDAEVDDIYVDFRDGAHALNGDRVEVTVTRRMRGGSAVRGGAKGASRGGENRLEGEVVRIIERSRRNYVGVLDVAEHSVFLRPDSRKIAVDIYVKRAEGVEYKNGQKAVVKIIDWTEGSKCPIGEVVEVLGDAGDNNTEMHAIMAEFDLPWEFDPRIEEAAEAIPDKITAAEIKRRRDFRSTTTFTIDPDDAKDFDDALSIKRLADVTESDGSTSARWEIGVHIADVTHYVTPGSVVDTEGENRATSVYLVDRTVPMLPEKLSNGLCSLRPMEEKLCFSAVFVMDDALNIHDEWFGRTVIRSDRRFTYEEAQRIIETGEGEFATEVLKFNDLAQRMRRRRFAKGAVSFDREEFKFRLAPDGKPIGVYHKVMKESNQLIEEFMLLANKKVAEFIGRNHSTGKKSSRTFVYRVHDLPDEEKLLKFSDFVIRFGYYFRPDRIKDVSKQMNALMEQIKGKSEENVISTLAIRTMAKAFYSTENIGHYGLSFPYYTHFTSPIRRYPDMMVHRLLAHYLDGGKSEDKQKYERLCEHSSQMEVRAAEAERASVKYKMAEFMLDRVGQEFNGHISGITDWGIYVELDESLIEGMVSMRDVSDDFYRFDENIYAAVGQANGRKFTLGDLVRIRVKGADLARRQIDFSLVATIDFETGKVNALPEVRVSGGGFGRRGDERVVRGKNGRGGKKARKEARKEKDRRKSLKY